MLFLYFVPTPACCRQGTLFNNTHYFSTNILPLTGQDGTRPVRDGILVENQHAAGSSAVRYAIIIVYRFKDESLIKINIKGL